MCARRHDWLSRGRDKVGSYKVTRNLLPSFYSRIRRQRWFGLRSMADKRIDSCFLELSSSLTSFAYPQGCYAIIEQTQTETLQRPGSHCLTNPRAECFAIKAHHEGKPQLALHSIWHSFRGHLGRGRFY